MKREFRLTRSTDFKRVRRMGKSYAHPLVVLITIPQEVELPTVRVGIVTGRSVGKAVERNRAKRRLRACIDRLLPDMKPGWDYVILARKSLDQAGFAEVCMALIALIKRSGLWYEQRPAALS